eukprot:1158696-Pelagomonas_calceolata.AAC.12
MQAHASLRRQAHVWMEGHSMYMHACDQVCKVKYCQSACTEPTFVKKDCISFSTRSKQVWYAKSSSSCRASTATCARSSSIQQRMPAAHKQCQKLDSECQELIKECQERAM